MSEDQISVILYRLDQIDETLSLIHAEVKRTNGRVNELEKSEAEWRGEEKAKATQRMIMGSVVAGGILAAIVWFVGAAI